MTPEPATDEITDDRPRAPLTRDRVLTGAIDLADRIGIEPFTIRKLASHLGVKPMTIYHHVASKGAILDGMIDIVFSEIDLPPDEVDWRTAIRHRSISAREVLNRHPWATPLMESRTSPGPATLRHHDAVLGCFRRGGFSVTLTAHAYAIVDSYLYGFALQEANLPFGGGEEIGELAEAIIEPLAVEQYPHLVELTTEHVLQPGYDFSTSFEIGLDLLLDGLGAAVCSEP
ncbi:MAG: TetR/AcrR family transcriptional regulator C-terminal domain-containing protein [Acidimicrobiia bacterium]|nr:TetR/AcrR family transcriptional regulator C-terminal domain-containing protein [Acidimicrobiia bacterium]